MKGLFLYPVNQNDLLMNTSSYLLYGKAYNEYSKALKDSELSSYYGKITLGMSSRLNFLFHSPDTPHGF
jgi:hypothetical protein